MYTIIIERIPIVSLAPLYTISDLHRLWFDKVVLWSTMVLTGMVRWWCAFSSFISQVPKISYTPRHLPTYPGKPAKLKPLQKRLKMGAKNYRLYPCLPLFSKNLKKSNLSTNKSIWKKRHYLKVYQSGFWSNQSANSCFSC